MPRKRTKAPGVSKWSLIILALACWSCRLGGTKPRKPLVLTVDASRIVHLIEPNEPFVSQYPAAVLSRGWYMELEALDKALKDGRLIWRD